MYFLNWYHNWKAVWSPAWLYWALDTVMMLTSIALCQTSKIPDHLKHLILIPVLVRGKNELGQNVKQKKVPVCHLQQVDASTAVSWSRKQRRTSELPPRAPDAGELSQNHSVQLLLKKDRIWHRISSVALHLQQLALIPEEGPTDASATA